MMFLQSQLSSQTADVVKGCIPLEVRFTSPLLSKYYWEFKDGGTSIEKDPVHSFVNPGTYKVVLKEGQSGNQIGSIDIAVFPDPVVTFTSVPKAGCTPLVVKFQSNVVKDSEIGITGYLWTFGDGNTSTDQNPTYTYKTKGIYNVSLKISTNFRECDKQILVEKEITVNAVNADFTPSSPVACTVPAKFTFKNNTPDLAGNTYIWNFGNGNSSQSYTPDEVSYNSTGSYTVSLIAANTSGCIDTIKKTIKVGAPELNLNVRDTYCFKIPLVLLNNSLASSFKWTFDNSASIATSLEKSPTVTYNTSGLKTINLSVLTSPTCKRDTSFQIFIEKVDADFIVDPEIECKKVMEYKLSAKNKSYESYFWNNTGVSQGPERLFKVGQEKRDSFYMHYVDSFFIVLTVRSKAGCIATETRVLRHQPPDAYILTENIKGCAPLTVSLRDGSFTHVPVKINKWIFSDGTVIDNKKIVNHTFNTPGEYRVKLIIENEKGCIDTSTAVNIFVGEKIQPQFQIDKYEICLGDSVMVNFLNTDPRIDEYHLTSDDGRFNHCSMKKSAKHAFIHSPGSFDVKGTVIYNGCISDINDNKKIIVKGAKSNIGYMVNCENPYEPMFKSKSVNGTQLKWTIVQDTVIEHQSIQDSFVHKFSKRGEYQVKLEAKDQSSCPASIDEETIWIKDIKASFIGDSILCDNSIYVYDASKSQDVHVSCSKGFKWESSFKRPRETVDTFHKVSVPAGDHFLSLIVEDINGCKDTLTKNLKSYGINPDMKISDTLICTPQMLMLTDLSTSDTTITSYKWIVGNKTFDNAGKILVTEILKENIAGEFLLLTLELEDAIGCTEKIFRNVKFYNVTSNIFINPGAFACVGATLILQASDFVAQGSSLTYDWDFGPEFPKSDKKINQLKFDKTGNYKVTLNYKEKSSGCGGTAVRDIKIFEIPDANFTSDADNAGEICHPKSIAFMNTTVSDHGVLSKWKFGNFAASSVFNPTETFPKGKHKVTLIAQSPYGCSDSISREYNLVGPEGKFIMDKKLICSSEKITGEKITFTIKDTVDVNKYTWDFGDGIKVENKSPISHEYNFVPNENFIVPRLILKTVENGCELILADTIKFEEVIAKFERIDSISCDGQVFLKNTSSMKAEIFNWEFGDNTTSTDKNPSHLYAIEGDYKILLIAFTNNGICKDSFESFVNLTKNNNVILFPNVFTPNDDKNNDFFNIGYDTAKVEKVELVAFKVYNRWGHLVYDNEDKINGWNGLYKEEEAPAEVYAYYIKLIVNNCNTFENKGNVTLIR